jgi:hypothetical protein
MLQLISRLSFRHFVVAIHLRYGDFPSPTPRAAKAEQLSTQSSRFQTSFI